MDDSTPFDLPWTAAAKFQPHRARTSLIKRERLLVKLDQLMDKRLALLVAPAGFGKSSLLGQWVKELQNDGVAVGWLTLDATEADGRQFLACLVSVIARAGVNVDDLLVGARGGFADSALPQIVSKVCRAIEAFAAELVIVLEDYHHAECDAVDQIIKSLLRATGHNLKIAIDSRQLPNIEAASLIAAGEAIEIGASQLRLTAEESLLVLDPLDNEKEALEIYAKTEGWPVAAQLALVQKRAQPNKPVLSGVDGGLIASYLTEQILSTMTDEAREVLLCIAFLDRFNRQLVNAACASEHAWGQIDALSSFAALFVSLDNEDGWFRLHHLFAEYLREQQYRRDPAKDKVVLLRASYWYEKERSLVEAVRYAAWADDFVRCEELIVEAGGWKIILHDGIGALRNALRQLPDDVITSRPRLLIARAYLHCKFGEILAARAALDAASKIESSDDRTTTDTDFLVVGSMINLYEDRASFGEDYRRLRETYVNTDALDALGQGTLLCEDVLLHLIGGEFGEASQCLRKAFRVMRESGSVLGLNYCYVHASQIALHQGDIAMAQANADRAARMADENFGSDSGLTFVASVLSLALKIWQGEAGPEDMETMEAALRHTIDYDGWTEIYITGVDALFHLARVCNCGPKIVPLVKDLKLFADRRNLSRLRKVVTVIDQCLTNESIGGAAGWDVGSDLAAFDDDPRVWQASMLAIVLSTERNDAASYQKAIAAAEGRGAQLWLTRIKLAETRSQWREGHVDKAKDRLKDLVKSTIQLGLKGPYLGDADTIRMLGELRSDLRRNEEELLTMQFIDEILVRNKELSPAKEESLLTDRENDVLEKLAEGLSNKQIARELELTENTVKFHLKSLFLKLGVSKRTQAVLTAQRRGLID